jgi:hypothetical protein
MKKLILGMTLGLLVLSAPAVVGQNLQTSYGSWVFFDLVSLDTTCTTAGNYILDFAADSSVVATVFGYTEITADQFFVYVFVYVDVTLTVSDTANGTFTVRDTIQDTITLPVCAAFQARSIRVSSSEVNYDGTARIHLTMEEDDQNHQVILDQYGSDGWFARDWQYSRTRERELVGATYTFMVEPASNGTFRFRGRVIDDYGGREYFSENVIELTFSNVSNQFRVANNGGSEPRLIHALEDASLADWPVLNTIGQIIGTTSATGGLPAGTLSGVYFVDTPGQRIQIIKRE